MKSERLYIVGPGTTTRAIFDRLGLPKTLLGVDVLHNRRLLLADVAERQLLDLVVDRQATIIVTIIGGQGYIFGRGNQQISPRVIRAVGKENLRVVTSVEKLTALNGRPLLVDTGDEEVDRMLTGYFRVITGHGEFAIYKIGYDLQSGQQGLVS
jgi:predicted polyphosphate/ATP-dependent NAD kinase